MTGVIGTQNKASELLFRQPSVEDVREIVSVMQESYRDVPSCSEEMVRAQIANYPDGLLVAESSSQIVGYQAMLPILANRALEWHTWLSITGHGCASSADPDGDHLYGFEFCVLPSRRGEGIGGRLLEARKNLCRSLGKKGIFLAARLSGYPAALEAGKARNPDEYLELVRGGHVFDPVASVDMKHGFSLLKVLPNYNQYDTGTLGFAALCHWSVTTG
jgi:GNAT superfamily N-acetyltransferase